MWIHSKGYEDICSLGLQREKLIKLGIPEQNITMEIGQRSIIEIGYDASPILIRERPAFKKLINKEVRENDILVVTK